MKPHISDEQRHCQNVGAATRQSQILRHMRREQKVLASIDDQGTLTAAKYLGDAIAWIEGAAKRAAKKPGGLGRK